MRTWNGRMGTRLSFYLVYNPNCVFSDRQESELESCVDLAVSKDISRQQAPQNRTILRSFYRLIASELAVSNAKRRTILWHIENAYTVPFNCRNELSIQHGNVRRYSIVGSLVAAPVIRIVLFFMANSCSEFRSGGKTEAERLLCSDITTTTCTSC